MRLSPISIPGDVEYDAPGAAPQSFQRISQGHRPLTLVQRQEDGSTHPDQTPAYGEAMAQSIETCARDLQRGELHAFEALWSRACVAISSFVMARRGVPQGASLTRSQSNLFDFLRTLNELDPTDWATPHVDSGWAQRDFIAGDVLACAHELQRGRRCDAFGVSLSSGDYQLVSVQPPEHRHAPDDEARYYELRIATPRLEGVATEAFVAWRLRADAQGASLVLRHRLFDNRCFGDENHAQAVSAHINALLNAVTARPWGAPRLDEAFEAYWWMLRQNQLAVADKAQHVLQAVLLAAGRELPPSPVGVDPALQALSLSLPDWLQRAPASWGLIGPRSILQRELTGRLPPLSLPMASTAMPSALLVDALCLGTSPGTRRRRAQREADASDMAEYVQANLNIA